MIRSQASKRETLITTLKFQPRGHFTKTGPMIFIVTQESATSIGLNVSGDENNIALNTDHSGLVKYQSRSQEEYKLVKGKLKRLVVEATREVSRQHTEKVDKDLDHDRMFFGANNSTISKAVAVRKRTKTGCLSKGLQG